MLDSTILLRGQMYSMYNLMTTFVNNLWLASGFLQQSNIYRHIWNIVEYEESAVKNRQSRNTDNIGYKT